MIPVWLVFMIRKHQVGDLHGTSESLGSSATCLFVSLSVPADRTRPRDAWLDAEEPWLLE